MATITEALLGSDVTTRPYFYLLLLLVSALWLFYLWQQQTRYFKLGNALPGPMNIPFLGNAIVLSGKSADGVLDMALNYGKEYGDVARIWAGSKLMVFLSDARDVEVILSSHVHIEKADEYKYFLPWLGDGLLISSGQKWRTHRKMIAPTFNINILKSFMNAFNLNSRNVIEKMKSQIGKTFDVHDYMSEVTVDILLETAMGVTKTIQDTSGFDYAMAVMKMCHIIHQRHYKVWMRIDAFFRLTSLYKEQKHILEIIHGLTKKVIRNKKETYLNNKANEQIPSIPKELSQTKTNENCIASNKTEADAVFKGFRDDLDYNDDNDIGAKKRLPFLDLMIDSVQNKTNNITDHEVKEQVDTIMFEGHDTTAAGSSFVLCLLGVNQKIQAKVYDELYEIFGSSDRPVTFEDTLNMKYLERVILETLRMYPPVPIIARKLNSDVKINTDNLVVPAGCTVVIATLKLHRNPKYYKNPDIFDPDNFLPENTQKRHYYSYIPFSAGPRSCVGRKYALLKLKVLLSSILRNYKVESDVAEDQFRLQADIILKRADGFRVRIEPRMRVPPTA